MVSDELTEKEQEEMEKVIKHFRDQMATYRFYNMKPTEEMVEVMGRMIRHFIKQRPEAYYLMDEWLYFLQGRGIDVIPDGVTL